MLPLQQCVYGYIPICCCGKNGAGVFAQRMECKPIAVDEDALVLVSGDVERV